MTRPGRDPWVRRRLMIAIRVDPCNGRGRSCCHGSCMVVRRRRRCGRSGSCSCSGSVAHSGVVGVQLRRRHVRRRRYRRIRMPIKWLLRKPPWRQRRRIRRRPQWHLRLQVPHLVVVAVRLPNHPCLPWPSAGVCPIFELLGQCSRLQVVFRIVVLAVGLLFVLGRSALLLLLPLPLLMIEMAKLTLAAIVAASFWEEAAPLAEPFVVLG
mmetsp:Transcript_39685/g.88986  ORF Transcript_39685/g.88986 Transcript_39685/m.88986 type:complete len:210 (+) Transcript_39685:179-808(+)